MSERVNNSAASATLPKSRSGTLFRFISRDGLEKLRSYKYVSGQYTICDTLMTPFWEWFVKLIPMVSKPCSCRNKL